MQSEPKRRKAKEPQTSDLNKMANSENYENKTSKDCQQMCTQIHGDRKNIALLMFLYVLQGIPLGLAGAIPYLLTSRKVSYNDQALFSFVYWPFSVKLLWAPIVDSIYISSFGRRKSWLVPVQYLIGIFMLVLSLFISRIMDEGNLNIYLLTTIFFFLNFLAATQDIAVDGWALTMLSRQNVAWASTCNTVGQTAGYFIGNVVFLALESPDFCNNFLRSIPQPEGIVTLSTFLKGCGIVFLITTTLVSIFKKERNTAAENNDEEFGLVETYKLLISIFKLKSIGKLVVILLTCKIGFAACDAVTALKLIEGGVPKEKLALFSIPMIPVQIILPIFISKYTTGPTPMNVFLKAIPFRLLGGAWLAVLVWWAPRTADEKGTIAGYFYIILLISYALHQVTIYSMYVAGMSFSATISDPAIGGTYMTLLNTISNFGGNWPGTVALWMVEPLTMKTCQADGKSCITHIDGYYVESIVCFIIGFLWLGWKSKTVRELQSLRKDEWTIKKNGEKTHS